MIEVVNWELLGKKSLWIYPLCYTEHERDDNTRMYVLIEVLWLQAISLDKIKDRRNQVKKAVSKETNDQVCFILKKMQWINNSNIMLEGTVTKDVSQPFLNDCLSIKYQKI